VRRFHNNQVFGCRCICYKGCVRSAGRLSGSDLEEGKKTISGLITLIEVKEIQGHKESAFYRQLAGTNRNREGEGMFLLNHGDETGHHWIYQQIPSFRVIRSRYGLINEMLWRKKESGDIGCCRLIKEGLNLSPPHRKVSAAVRSIPWSEINKKGGNIFPAFGFLQIPSLPAGCRLPRPLERLGISMLYSLPSPHRCCDGLETQYIIRSRSIPSSFLYFISREIGMCFYGMGVKMDKGVFCIPLRISFPG
jgi:hypothetical protein